MKKRNRAEQIVAKLRQAAQSTASNTLVVERVETAIQMRGKFSPKRPGMHSIAAWS